jgi:hypothetical protein
LILKAYHHNRAGIDRTYFSELGMKKARQDCLDMTAPSGELWKKLLRQSWNRRAWLGQLGHGG